MKVIRFEKWTSKKVNEHPHGFTNTLSDHYINIIILGFHFKLIEWKEYINHHHNN